jgi:hypothetical protein
MRRIIWLTEISLAVGVLGVAVVVAASGLGHDSEVGTGFLDVGDLGLPGQGQLVAKAVPMQARLVLHPNGCVTVVVDGVERMPLWPEGTDVHQKPGNLTQYQVDLPGDVTLSVNAVSADTFSAVGVIDLDDATVDSEAGDPEGKVGSFLAYCEIKTAPVVFPDAATFAVRGT